MSRNVARLTALQAHRELLVATARMQRVQFQEDLRQARSTAHDAVDRTKQRLCSVGIAAVAVAMAAAAVSWARRSPLPTRLPQPSMLHRALPWIRLAASLWVTHRGGGSRESPADTGPERAAAESQ